MAFGDRLPSARNCRRGTPTRSRGHGGAVLVPATSQGRDFLQFKTASSIRRAKIGSSAIRFLASFGSLARCSSPPGPRPSSFTSNFQSPSSTARLGDRSSPAG